ncbi:hypothetical protein [Terrabacter sp. MAHUQ-38]|uniref:hypothetical protein n=1 Tax=unclassified Terrabacter TaxID=2630222 RepID=UPI00165E0CBC|nr:hypothetical protein [Terrabacter sp. MAHUQ-38]
MPEQLASAIRDFVIHHANDHTTARVINYELAALTEAHRREIGRLRHTGRPLRTAVRD